MRNGGIPREMACFLGFRLFFIYVEMGEKTVQMGILKYFFVTKFVTGFVTKMGDFKTPQNLSSLLSPCCLE
jgi:hypothetical protein